MLTIKIKSRLLPRVWHFPASVRRWVAAALLLFVFSAPNIASRYPGLERARLEVLRSPNAPQPHLRLARLAALASDWDVARSELSLATRLAMGQRDESTAPDSLSFERVGRDVNLHEVLLQSAQDWLALTLIQPGYRDAHLRLAIMHYRLFDDASSLIHFREAWMLDPNNAQVQAIGSVLGYADEEIGGD